MNWKGAVLVILLIHAAALLADKVPSQVINVALVNQFTIGVMLVWGFVQLRRMEAVRLIEVERLRAELAAHRIEIVSALDHRVEDLKELHETARALAVKTDTIAAILAQKTQARHEQLTTEVGAIKSTIKSVAHTQQAVKNIKKKP